MRRFLRRVRDELAYLYTANLWDIVTIIILLLLIAFMFGCTVHNKTDMCAGYCQNFGRGYSYSTPYYITSGWAYYYWYPGMTPYSGCYKLEEQSIDPFRPHGIYIVPRTTIVCPYYHRR